MGLRCFLNGFRIGQDQCRSYWPDNAAKMRDPFRKQRKPKK